MTQYQIRNYPITRLVLFIDRKINKSCSVISYYTLQNTYIFLFEKCFVMSVKNTTNSKWLYHINLSIVILCALTLHWMKANSNHNNLTFRCNVRIINLIHNNHCKLTAWLVQNLKSAFCLECITCDTICRKSRQLYISF